jgi:hypothetical protein
MYFKIIEGGGCLPPPTLVSATGSPEFTRVSQVFPHSQEKGNQIYVPVYL